MKAAVVKKDFNENKRIKIKYIDNYTPMSDEVLIKVLYCGVTPYDYLIQLLSYKIDIDTFIPGIETVGFVEEVGEDVGKVEEGDYVTTYPRNFYDGQDRDNVVNGCYAEYVIAHENDVFKISRNIDPQLAVTLPYDVLTAYHVLNKLDIEIGEPIIVLGAASDIGIYLTQLIKARGGYVIGISGEKWVSDYGVDLILSLNRLKKYIENKGISIRYVFDSDLKNHMDIAINALRSNGVYFTIGYNLKKKIVLNINKLVSRRIKIICSSGGTLDEFLKVIKLAEKKLIKSKTWRIYPLEHAEEAIKALFSKDKRGKILLRP